MERERKYLLLSMLAVGGAAAYAWASPSRPRTEPPRASAASEAHVRARVVDDLPPGATVVPVSSGTLARFPVARATVRRAVRRDARDEWVGATVEGAGAERIPEDLHRDLPHFESGDPADADRDGVYVRCDGRLVLLTAVGVALTDRHEH